MSALGWVLVVLGCMAIALLWAAAMCAAASTPTPRPQCRRYVAPGDDVYHAYKEFGGKGRKF